MRAAKPSSSAGDEMIGRLPLLLGVAAAGALLWRYKTSRTPHHGASPARAHWPRPDDAPPGLRGGDLVEEASEDSFPASDSPAYSTPGRIGGPLRAGLP